MNGGTRFVDSRVSNRSIALFVVSRMMSIGLIKEQERRQC
jgi:hypothetical protein